MEPQPRLAIVASIQQAISSLLTTYEPEFLRFGVGLFLSFATILIVWQGIRMMFSHEGVGEQMFDFAKLLLFISFDYALTRSWAAPLRGEAVSSRTVPPRQAHFSQGVLEPRASHHRARHFDDL